MSNHWCKLLGTGVSPMSLFVNRNYAGGDILNFPITKFQLKSNMPFFDGEKNATLDLQMPHEMCRHTFTAIQGLLHGISLSLLLSYQLYINKLPGSAIIPAAFASQKWVEISTWGFSQGRILPDTSIYSIVILHLIFRWSIVFPYSSPQCFIHFCSSTKDNRALSFGGKRAPLHVS